MSTEILLLNAGSSSIKYQVIDADDERVLATGLIERIGETDSDIKHEVGGQAFKKTERYADHTEALKAMVAMFQEHGPDLDAVKAVGHRTVHGGDELTQSCLINDAVVDTLARLSPLAPLHNPAGIQGIRAAQAALPGVPHVAIFDTAFFSSLPAESYTYAIDADLAREYKIRRYGFHGTSHNFVSHEVAEFLGEPYDQLRQIVCHLGNGASMSAISGGVAIDTSMGLTPLPGLVMGTRSGDIDPSVIAYLHRAADLDGDAVDTLLNKKSGLLGLCGYNDMRDVLTQIEAGNAQAKLAFDVYIHRLVFYIGAYIGLLGGVDAVTFTAGVGENSAPVREAVCRRLEGLGFLIDPDRNDVRSKEPRLISTDDSPVKVLIVPTNEELQMAREVKAVIEG